MSGINKVIVLGRLGNDVEYNADKGYASMSIATSEKWADKETGEMNEKTEWHRVKVFGKLAGLCAQYLTKGRQVYFEGKLQTSSYEKDGVKMYSTDVIANKVEFLGGKTDGASEGVGAEAPAANLGNGQFAQAAMGSTEGLPNHAPGADNSGF